MNYSEEKFENEVKEIGSFLRSETNVRPEALSEIIGQEKNEPRFFAWPIFWRLAIPVAIFALIVYWGANRPTEIFTEEIALYEKETSFFEGELKETTLAVEEIEQELKNQGMN